MTITRQIVAGGEGDFTTVRKVTVSGSGREVGAELAAEAAATYGWAPVPAEPVRVRARLAWFERYWPQHHERMLGAAESLGLDAGRFHFDALSGLPTGSGCSATFLSPSATEEGRGLFGRNYDFFTTSATELFAFVSGENSGGPASGELPMASRPYVLSLVPDDGPASTVLTMNELDGCTEGINEHGLAVALLIANAETLGAPVQAGPQVGLSPIQLPRFVLDTCATADEARRALLAAKHYDLGAPLHYLIADASGDAFVWERGPGGAEHIFDIDGDALCLTNHYLHEQGARDTDNTMLSHYRYRTLRERTAESGFSGKRLREMLDEVGFASGDETGGVPLRTLWSTVFDLGERTMSTWFYLGDSATGEARRSAELTFGPGLLAG
ncbi:Predicted choloylglycine hydrolase [Saccharopolyspora kobensis]|uniref:Predicted choloylglycine hydrolase n=1 Tax=Saccharopolyspora kobensis TaxID=146035 RepID=A0A1H5X9A1_9PSEU|nr:C45 family peptidase [Saccharopolyspora kobensis]SEG07816.1 Predicted choloylglycine hydrolase [Saccharopolyspora kobensis]SFE46299.1 Predicted choloylglycine hydrolase [Saccharopolyspora kobensis]